MGKTIWIFAGESSGDLYGGRLATALQALAPDLVLRGMGGSAMRAAGVEIMVDSSNLGVVGFIEVFKHLGTFFRIFNGLVARAARERPDVVVLIDYPGFNLRFAKKLHALGIPVVYYISPQVWAWGKRRIPEIARLVRKLLVIFPFEPEVYAGTGLDVEFVGHPLKAILAERRDASLTRDPHTIVLLPGSRTSEVDRLFADLCRTAAWLQARRPELQFVVAASSPRIADRCHEMLKGLPAADVPQGVVIRTGETHEWLQRATAGLAASGTVTMESALLGLPLVVVYRLNPITYWLGRLLVKLPFFTIVNLVAGRRVFEEFLQGDVTARVLGPALEAILPGGARRADVEAGIQEALARLGAEGDASQRAAESVRRLLQTLPSRHA